MIDLDKIEARITAFPIPPGAIVDVCGDLYESVRLDAVALLVMVRELEAERDSESRWAAQYLAECNQSRARVRELEGLLREVEWVQPLYYTDGYCPYCEGFDHESGHRVGCRWLAAMGTENNHATP